jgi:lipopolysaccharide transport system ATP-binding protein
MIVRCDDISKKFRWYERSDSLKSFFVSRFRPSGEKWEWYVLSHLSFEVARGERVAIIGRNGSGKSTLLKLIAGIYAPTEGTVHVDAKRMLALIELGVGFYPDLTGRQNIRLNWALNGMPRAELRRRFDEIVAFSGVEDFLDTPLKYYSSGMAARLGFSVAMMAEPELLIVDEVLAVGDAEFQQRCYDRIDALCRAGTTLILVSHNLSDVARTCSRGIWIADGRIACDGPVDATINRYLSEVEH